MYFVLDRFGAKNPCRWVDDWPYIDGVDWMDGARHRVPISEPLEIPLKRLNPDSADHGPEMPEYLKGQIPLFRDDLVVAMQEAGVDNLDLYRTIVRDPDSGTSYQNYKAVNIIGAISAADMAKSKATVHGAPLIDTEFDELVVDAARARGALIFRLAEATATILVHQKLRDHLVAKGFTKLEFLEPSQVAI